MKCKIAWILYLQACLLISIIFYYSCNFCSKNLEYFVFKFDYKHYNYKYVLIIIKIIQKTHNLALYNIYVNKYKYIIIISTQT